ncbi:MULTISPECIES: ATP-binding protein [unclassified Pseudoalteromonas]|uniref:ATP-binding protein n=1 Tax=unclassified Pseudoalteromonas TaxID=194690 RepID=UPI0005A6EBF9|nr:MULTISPECIES: ATP-binding protein [unclassified Pseudoalteromonas]
MEPVNIDELINKSLVLVANELEYKVELITQLEASSVIYGYPQKLQQVFINLLVNASHAIQNSGKVWITSKLIDSEVNKIINTLIFGQNTQLIK